MYILIHNATTKNKDTVPPTAPPTAPPTTFPTASFSVRPIVTLVKTLLLEVLLVATAVNTGVMTKLDTTSVSSVCCMEMQLRTNQCYYSCSYIYIITHSVLTYIHI